MAKKTSRDHQIASTCRTEPLVVLLPEIEQDACSLEDDCPPGDHLDLLRRLCPDHQNAPGGNNHLRGKQVCR